MRSTATAIAALTSDQATTAWPLLVERHGADVFRLICSRLADRHAAEDAYQEFWMGLPAAAARFRPDPADPERKARAWLMHIAYTSAIAQHRQHARQAGRAMAPHEVEMETQEHQDSQDEMIERVRQAVERLPEESRRPLLLHIVAGLSYEDLATDLRCTVSNARVKVHRGLKRLRDLLGVEGGRLSEQTLSGLLLPPLLPPPALPSLPPVPPAIAPPPAVGPLAALAKAPLLVAAGVAVTATAVVGGIVVLHRPSEEPATMIRPLAATALATAGLAAATALDDFDRPEAGMTSNSKALVAIVPAPAGIGQGGALRIGWPGEHKAFVDCYYQEFRAAPLVTSDGAATATLKVWVEAFSGVQSVAIRFTDTRNETWQWSAPLPDPGQSGWRILSIPIVPERNKGHWGPPGAINGVIDFPVRLNGYAVGFEKETIPAGSILIDDVSVTTSAPAAP